MPPTNFSDLIKIFLDLIQVVIPVIAGLALLVFFWGLFKFILRVGGDEKAVTEGKSLMIWGLIALFVLVSIWGIMRFLSGELGFGTTLKLPFLPE
ncbi:MAG: hypothetical protein Q8Q92_04385 [bacterium]|nr:hypothetical protein [bacterium]